MYPVFRSGSKVIGKGSANPMEKTFYMSFKSPMSPTYVNLL
jgi:hypothetical protein